MIELLRQAETFNEELRNITQKLTDLPQQAARIQQDIEKVQHELEQKKKRLTEVRAAYRTREGDVAENDAQIARLNQQLLAVKTNEEYRATLNEIDYLRKAKAKIEDEMIRLLEEEETLKSSLGKYEKETLDFVEKKSREIESLNAATVELREREREVRKSFDDTYARLPEDVKRIYERIARARGNAVALVRNNICTGCYTSLTPQLVNELKRKQKIVTCEVCGRILVYVGD